MAVIIRQFEESDIPEMTEIWNAVVQEGRAFPQTECLTKSTAGVFFKSQTFTGVAVDGRALVGLYILHPNNIGRCGHISNASYAVKSGNRGQKTGEYLVLHSMESAKKSGFRILQFNAVVATNTAALKLYKKLGFTRLGRIPGGFLSGDNVYLDIIPHYISLC